MKATRLQILICSVILFAACNNSVKETGTNKKGVTKKEWGTVDNKPVYLFTLTNSKGDYVTITNYGGTITSFVVPDKNGNKSSIIIGFDSLSVYLKHPPYFGATIGRYGNRIGNAQFKLGDSIYHLAANDGKNSLHGGVKGFDKVVWDATVSDSTSPELSLTYLSKDGEEGYPGNLKVTVVFTFTDSDELKIQYAAETDKPTPVNLTNHSYFNLTGDVSNTILQHTLMIDADAYTPVDSTLIPTGEIKPVKGTPFDFTTAKKIGRDINEVPGGYDHNWVLNNKNGALEKVAVLSDSISGRTLELFTTQPGLQFYAGNFLDGSFINRDGKPIKLRTALCLEAQHFPDSPNKPGFPSTILQPGEQYSSTIIYKLIVE